MSMRSAFGLGWPSPYGEPAGVYLLELVGDSLEIRQTFPARDGQGSVHDYDWIRAGE